MPTSIVDVPFEACRDKNVAVFRSLIVNEIFGTKIHREHPSHKPIGFAVFIAPLFLPSSEIKWRTGNIFQNSPFIMRIANNETANQLRVASDCISIRRMTSINAASGEFRKLRLKLIRF